MTQIQLTDEQKQVHDAVIEWHKGKKPKDIRIGGFAGTGKSVVTAAIAKTLREKNPKLRVAFACFTGKAAYVLREKLAAAEVAADAYVGTIHGLMYEPVVRGGTIIKWRRVPEIEVDLIVIDEASMVGETVWKDLRSYKRPIIAVGDHGQLPPVGSGFNLMEKPDHTLLTIHRQAAGNPIIKASILAREEGRVPHDLIMGADPDAYVKRISMKIENVVRGVKDGSTMFLCGRNQTRTRVNAIVRERLGFKGPIPIAGERVICLKNNREVGIFNGMGGIIHTISDAGHQLWYKAQIEMDDGTMYAGDIIKDQFGAQATLREHPKIDPMDLRDLFDWGYCLTVHKAQGSEADNVVLFEERFSQSTDEDWRRWLYTGVTRARKRLLIVGRE